MEFNLMTYLNGIVAVTVGMLVIILLVMSIVAGYIKNVNAYEERKKSNYFMMNGVNKKEKVKDIRDEVSLGYMDLQKKNNLSLLDRIKRCAKTIKDEIAVIKESPKEI